MSLETGENSETAATNSNGKAISTASVEAEGATDWGWDHTPIESDETYSEASDRRQLPVVMDEVGGKPPRGDNTPRRLSGSDIRLNGSQNGGLQKMTSSQSFLELEKAIGATLAMGLNSSESLSSLNSDPNNPQYYQHTSRSNSRNSLHRSRSFGKQQQIFRPYSYNNLMAANVVPPSARAELDPFVNEYESRALILFHSPNINPVVVRNAAQKCGVLYYIRPEFHTRYGVTLLSYFDLRAATLAQSTLASELASEDSPASAHFSVMLHAGAGTNSEEYRLIVQKVPSQYLESDIEARFSQFGELRSIQKLFGEGDSAGDQSSISYSIEYFNIQDARLAASEMSATIGQFWGTEAEISFAPLDSRKQALCRQLLATLSRWRAELASSFSFSQSPVMMAPGSPGGGFPLQYGDNRGGMMMMSPPQQQHTQQQYSYPPAAQGYVGNGVMYPHPMDGYGMHMMMPPDTQQHPHHQYYSAHYDQPPPQQQVIPQQQPSFWGPTHSSQMSNGQGPPPLLLPPRGDSSGAHYSMMQPSSPSHSTHPPIVVVKGGQQQQQHLPPHHLPLHHQHHQHMMEGGMQRPLHHNGGHGYARKNKGQQMGGHGQNQPTDAEFVVDLRRLAISNDAEATADSSESQLQQQQQPTPVDRRTTLMVACFI